MAPSGTRWGRGTGALRGVFSQAEPHGRACDRTPGWAVSSAALGAGPPGSTCARAEQAPIPFRGLSFPSLPAPPCEAGRCDRASRDGGPDRGDRKEAGPRERRRVLPGQALRRPRAGGAVAQKPSAPPARARPRAHAPGAQGPVSQSPPPQPAFPFPWAQQGPEGTRRSLPHPASRAAY
jgi:hypothetical protein